MMSNPWIAGALTLLTLTSPAWAQGAGAPTRIAPRLAAQAGSRGGGDGRAQLSPAALAALQGSARGQLSAAQATRLTGLLTQDKTIDPTEYDAIDELLSEKIRTVAVASSASPADPLILGTQFGEARPILEACLEAHVEATLGAPPTAASWARTLQLAEVSAGSELRVRRVLVGRLRPALERSAPADAYKPIGDAVQALFHLNEELPEARRPAGRWLIWSACKQLDQDTGDRQLPDFLYSWTAPKP